MLTAGQGLRRLMEGNKRFVAGKARFPTVCKDTLAALAKGQQPYATILGCADSRVPPELVFDANFGELFILRVAGNVISPEIMGSIQYAGSHLKTPLFVVLGHEGCGAVKAAIEHKWRGTKHLSRIQVLVNNISPALAELDHRLPAPELLMRGIEANVRWSMKQLLATPEGQKAAREGQKKLIGAVFEINSGKVRFLDEAS